MVFFNFLWHHYHICLISPQGCIALVWIPPQSFVLAQLSLPCVTTGLRTSIKTASNEDNFPLMRSFKKWNYTGDKLSELPPLLFMSLWDVDVSRVKCVKAETLAELFSQATN